MMRLLAPLAAIAVALAGTASLSAQDLNLEEGWNLAPATGESVEEYVESRNEANECDVLAIWRYEQDQTWSAWFSNAPEQDEVGSLGGQHGYWVFCG